MSNRLDVLIVVPSVIRGGCETHLSVIVPKLRARGLAVEIMLLAHRGPLAEPLEAAGAPLIDPWIEADPSRPRALPTRVLRLAAVSLQLWLTLAWRRPRAVHFFLPSAYWIGGGVSLFAPWTLRVMSRRSLSRYLDGRPKLQALERFLHQRMHGALGNASAVAGELIAEGAPPERVRVIRNGVKAPPTGPEARAAARARLGVEEGRFALLVVANLIPLKGHLDLVDALSRVNERLPPSWVLLLAGRDDGHGAVILERARALGLADRIRLLGSRSDAPDLFAGADLVVLPSHEEGFSNALIEALGAGAPIIATDVGGAREAIEDGVSGVIVPPRDPAALAAAIAALAAAPESRAALGAAAAARMRALFDVERCVDGYVAFYTGLFATAKPPSQAALEASS